MNLEKRVENLENAVTELRVDVAEIKATLPSLAKQEDLAAVRAQLPYCATHADITKLLMWMIGVGATSVVGLIIGILNYFR